MQFYTILGLKKEATKDEILAVYHGLIQSGEINNPQKRYALSVLNNQESRTNYDTFIRYFESVPKEKDITELFLAAMVENPKYAGYLLENEISFPINFENFLKILKNYPRFTIDKIPNFKIILHADYCDPKLRIDLFECVRQIYPELDYDDKYLDLLDKSGLLAGFFKQNKRLALILCIYYLRTDLLQKINYKSVFKEISIKDLYTVWAEGTRITHPSNVDKIRETFKMISQRRLTGDHLEAFLREKISTPANPNIVEVFKLMLSQIEDDVLMTKVIDHAFQHLKLNGEYIFRAIIDCLDNENLRIRVTQSLLQFNPIMLQSCVYQSTAFTTLMQRLKPFQLQLPIRPPTVELRL